MLKRLIYIVFVCFLTGNATLVSANEELPPELRGLGVDERLGQKISLDNSFKDESGKEVQLAQYFDGKKPVLLSLVYYSCPSLCNLILNAQLDTLKKLDWSVGNQFRIITVSIDPKETPALASAKKESYLKEYGRAGAEADWHFLTGTKDNIDKLAQEMGFKFKWVEETQQYAHGSAFFILTGDGLISRYIYGLTYEPKMVRMSLLEAGQGRIGTFMDKLVLFCFHYDATQKKYVVLANRIMTFGATGCCLILGVYLGLLWRRERKTV